MKYFKRCLFEIQFYHTKFSQFFTISLTNADFEKDFKLLVLILEIENDTCIIKIHSYVLKVCVIY